MIAQPIDILPTLCELAEISVKSKQEIQGRSFANSLLKGSTVHREYAVSGYFVDKGIPRKATTPFLVTKQWGYTPIGANGRSELYDIKKDPLCENNISFDETSLVKELHKLFIKHLYNYMATDEFVSFWNIE